MSGTVNGRVAPPASGTSTSPPEAPPANTMAPSAIHTPPRGSGAGASRAGPPARLMPIVRSSPAAKKATRVESGDQNGWKPPSVPARARLRSEDRSCSSRGSLSPASAAGRTANRPSGDSASPNVCRGPDRTPAPSGSSQAVRTAGCAAGGAYWRARQAGTASRPPPRANAPARTTQTVERPALSELRAILID
jgi:hypothetical protein